MSSDHEIHVDKLLQAEPDITKIAIIRDKEIVYSTSNWDASADLTLLTSNWLEIEEQSINISGVRYSILQHTSERLVATSVKGDGHLVGAKDEEIIIIAHVEPGGKKNIAYVEIARLLASMSSKAPYIDPDVPLGKGYILEEIKEEVEAEVEVLSDSREKMMEELDILKKMIHERGKTPESPEDESDNPLSALSLRSAILQEVKDVLNKGINTLLNSIKEEDKETINEHKRRRFEELEKIEQALRVSKEIETVKITFKTEFNAPYIYNDLDLLRVRYELERIIRNRFQIEGTIKVKLTKDI